jgi:hypothetical protein
MCRGFFGSVHWDAYFSLDSSVSLVARLIPDLLRGMFDNIRQLAEYIDALKASERLPPYIHTLHTFFPLGLQIFPHVKPRWISFKAHLVRSYIHL